MHATAVTGDEAARLRAGLATLGLNLDDAAQQRCQAYLDLLERWNRSYNLTAVRERERMLTAHILDSLAVVSYLRAPRCLDIGTGAGLPGIPLAIARPDLEFVLLDSNLKKTRFVHHAASELGLDNVRVARERLERLRAPDGFSTLLSRAFASLRDMTRASHHLLAPGGCWLALKGRHPQAEITALPADVRVQTIDALAIPGLDAQRHVVVLERTA